MKLLCWNINSLSPTVRNAVLKYGSWAGFFQEHGVDIVCLQESKMIDEKLTRELCCVEGFQSFWACSREKKGYSGVVTYAGEAWAPLSCRADCLGSGDDDIDREGRVVITDHGAFVLVNVYVPNAGDRPARARLPYKLRFLQALQRACDELMAQGRELLVVGDFNVPAETRDVHPTLMPAEGFDALYSPEERAALHALTGRFTDVWRHLHPAEASTYTVWNEKTSARAFNQGLRIDYVLASPGLLSKVESCEVLGAEVLPAKWSDHAGLLLEVGGVAPPPPHPPCPQWLRLHRRFVDTSQRSILGMFARKRPATAAAQSATGAAAAAAAAAPLGAEVEQAKRRRTGGGGAGGAAPHPPNEPVVAVGDQDADALAARGGESGAGGSQAADDVPVPGEQLAEEQPQKQVAKQKLLPHSPSQKQQDKAKKEMPGQRTIGSFFAGGGCQSQGGGM